MITLRIGSHDPHVVFLQRLLNTALTSDRSIEVLDEDCKFGPKTDVAVRRFQSTYTGAAGKQSPDGEVVTPTWRAFDLISEIFHPLPMIGQNTQMSCWEVAGGLASGRMSSTIPGLAQFIPLASGSGGGLPTDRANLDLYAKSLGLRLLPKVPDAIEDLEPMLRNGPLIMFGRFGNGSDHAVVLSDYFAGNKPLNRMIRINNSAPAGHGSIQLTDYPNMLLNGGDFRPKALVGR